MISYVISVPEIIWRKQEIDMRGANVEKNHKIINIANVILS